MRAVIIGLDGVPASLISVYSGKGHLPNIAKAIARGSLVTMESSIPDVSSTAWSSVITGTNPGVHGIYGFIEVDPETYRFRFPNFKDLRAKPFWHDCKAAVVNIPQTFPAAVQNGFMVSGFVALDLERAVAPKEYLDDLRGIGYMLDVDLSLGQSSTDAFMVSVYESLDARMRLFHLLWDREQWDLFYFVFTETDRVNHFLFEAWDDTKHPLHETIVRFYRKVDEMVGIILDRAGDGVPVYLHSDHGFCPLTYEVNINRWLMEEGFLKYTTPSPRTLMDMDPRSTAFALDPARIYINSSDRFTMGSVPPGDKAKIKEAIIERLGNLKIDGVSPVSQILDGGKIFHGLQTDRAPDLVLLGARGYDLKANVSNPALYGRRHFTGMHTHDDAFFIAAQQEMEPLSQPFHVERIAPLIRKRLELGY